MTDPRKLIGKNDGSSVHVFKLFEAVKDIMRRWPDAVLSKNAVGNLAIFSGGVYVGWLDLRNGNVNE